MPRRKQHRNRPRRNRNSNRPATGSPNRPATGSSNSRPNGSSNRRATGDNYRFIQDDCYANCVLNLPLVRLNNNYSNAQIVVGSLGIGQGKAFFEYGHKEEKSYPNYLNINGQLDCHFWIEININGTIYIFDFFYHIYYTMVAKFRKTKLSPELKGNQLLIKTAEELQQ
jgi:hypothetical protein